MIPKYAQQLLDEISHSGYRVKGSEKGLILSVKKTIALNKLITHGQEVWLYDIYGRAISERK